ncbi:MAG TPA: protein dehydratase, partial [Beijerinckiaceae bacterium]|nr:protein dehydratase [Beijerinckiaceae bacterium]
MRTEASLDVAHLSRWIGREETVVDGVGEDLARKFHAMLALPGPVPKAGDPAPRIIHFCLGQ